ncbi:TIGR04255 family protein [Parelusimicrobium proximum]|uniref:TIGR04255 family protein n=1 Tax=Parelusimicrobium proximum TaxID=3228953 RepID=UPI003D184406
MVTKNNIKLKNPPIIESRMGLIIPDFFTKLEDLDSVLEKIKEILPKVKPIRDIKNPDMPKEEREKLPVLGYAAGSEDFTQFIALEKGRVLYVDKEKYTDFDTMFSLLKRLWSAIDFKNSGKKIEQIALSTYNSFGVKYDDEMPAIAPILPSINTHYPGKTESEIFAGESRSQVVLGKYVNTSDEIQALVDTALKFDGEKNIMNVRFDTECSCSPKGMDVESLEKQCQRLRNFRNEIFFLNVDAEKIGSIK